MSDTRVRDVIRTNNSLRQGNDVIKKTAPPGRLRRHSPSRGIACTKIALGKEAATALRLVSSAPPCCHDHVFDSNRQVCMIHQTDRPVCYLRDARYDTRFRL